MIESIQHKLDRILLWVGNIASFLLFVLVGIMAYNVIARYAFNASSLGLEELSWHIYAAIFLLGIPYTLSSDSHVRVDILYEKFTPRTQALINLVGSSIFLLPTCLIIIWTGWNFTMASYQLGAQPDNISSFFTQLITAGIGERSQDSGGLLNRWIIKGVIPFSFLLLLLATISLFLKNLQLFLTSKNEGQSKETK